VKTILSCLLLLVGLSAQADVSFPYTVDADGTYFISFMKENHVITSRRCSKPLPASAAPVTIYNCAGSEKTTTVEEFRAALKRSISYGVGFGPTMKPLTELEVLSLKDERARPRKIDIFFAQRDLRELTQYIAENGMEESLVEKQRELQMIVGFDRNQASALKKIDEEMNKVLRLMEDATKLHPFVEVPIIRTGLMRIAL
jgi:hypothetical protein